MPDLAPGTAFENASLLDVASHTACLFPDGAKWTDAAWTQYTQAHYFNGTIAGREVWVKNIFQYGAVSNCTPELTTATNYVHVDGAVVLALIEERLSGLDFGALAKTLIFDPLNMSSAEVVDANPAGGLWATLSDLGIYGQWLVQGYNGRPEALAKTLLKQKDFLTLLSPITKPLGIRFGRSFGRSKEWRPTRIWPHLCSLEGLDDRGTSCRPWRLSWRIFRTSADRELDSHRGFSKYT